MGEVDCELYYTDMEYLTQAIGFYMMNDVKWAKTSCDKFEISSPCGCRECKKLGSTNTLCYEYDSYNDVEEIDCASRGATSGDASGVIIFIILIVFLCIIICVCR